MKCSLDLAFQSKAFVKASLVLFLILQKRFTNKLKATQRFFN